MDDSERRRSLDRRSFLGSLAATSTGLAASALAGRSRAAGTPEVHVEPTVYSAFLRDLSENPDQWDWVADHVDGVGFHANYLEPRPPWVDVPTYQPRHLITLAEIADDHDLDVSLEIGGPSPRYRPFDARIADRAANDQVERIERVENAGGTVDHLNVDGPIRRQLKGVGQIAPERKYGFDTVDRCIQSFLTYCESIWLRHPSVSFYAITNFPNWGWNGGDSLTGADWGDYRNVVRPMLDAMDRSRVPFEGIMVDNPYNYGGFDRLAELESLVESRGFEFNLIVNDEAGTRSGSAFADRTRKYVSEVRRRGISPGRYTIESWYEYPKRTVPETDPSTMTGLAKDVTERVKGARPAPTPGDGSPTALYRLYHAGRSDHRYTIDAGERRRAKRAGYDVEGVACTVFDGRRPGTVPLYELYRPDDHDHFYTTSASERDAAARGGYRKRGIAAHVYPGRQGGARPLYRLYDARGGDHFYTASSREKDLVARGPTYEYEGVQCYVE